MKTQKEVFKSSEADQWYLRNKDYLIKKNSSDERILNLIKELNLNPKKVLEIGCSSGYRLNFIEQIFKNECYGLDPSSEAIQYGTKHFSNIQLQIGTADNLPFKDDSFDLLIFGFSLYLCDRKDLFKIAYEADRVLADKGNIFIYDFFPPFAYKNEYSHHDDIYSYKMDYSKLFSWNPHYYLVSHNTFTHSGLEGIDIPDNRIAIMVLRKSIEKAYPFSPFKD